MNTERKNTLVISFVERNVIRPSPYEIHEWIAENLHLDEQEVEMIQLNGLTRQVFVKCFHSSTIEKILKDTHGTAKFLHSNGQVSSVTLETAGIGSRAVKIFNLPIELPTAIINQALVPYGKVISTNNDTWGPAFRYKVCNGVRTVRIMLTKHIPSYLVIGGYKALISYENQPITCAKCNEAGHIRSECPRRQVPIQINLEEEPLSWAKLVESNITKPRQVLGNENKTTTEEKENSTVQIAEEKIILGSGNNDIIQKPVESKQCAVVSTELGSKTDDMMEMEENNSDDVREDMEETGLNTTTEENYSKQGTKMKQLIEHNEDKDDKESRNPNTDVTENITEIGGIQIRPYVRPNTRDPRLEKRRLEDFTTQNVVKSRKATPNIKGSQNNI